MITVREALARSAVRLWEEDYRDENFEKITELFVENDFGWHVERDGTGGLYDQSPGLEYCGHTVAVAGRRMGDYAFDGRCVNVQLDPALCRTVLPSTTRLALDRKWRKAGFERHTEDEVVRGAVCTTGSSTIGGHIVLAIGEPNDQGEFETIEGNAYGHYPDGTNGKGVVRRSRNLDEVAQIYIFGPEHCHGTSEIFVRPET